MTEIVTRFAPSPTGYLHLGGARTALFNWLYARGRGGRFLLRIEDTDRSRSTPEATRAILDGLAWLGLDHDGEAVSQFSRIDRHAEIARRLLDEGKAYKCFAPPEELQRHREAVAAKTASGPYQSPWRDADPATHPDGSFAIRFRTPREGSTVVEDGIQGSVRVENALLDDLVLLRGDGTPVYMLAVVVDDRDMGVTHVIRGDDHLGNAARQAMICDALDWPRPVYAHVPLIHSQDGAKLSKRHGAVAVEDYRRMGFPAAGMRNYLARLGWSHGDDEFFTDAQAAQWFDLSGVGKAPSRFDAKKLRHVCGLHLAAADDAALMPELLDHMAAAGLPAPAPDEAKRIGECLPFLKSGAKTLADIAEKARFITIARPIVPDEKAAANLDAAARTLLGDLTPRLREAIWTRDGLEAAVTRFAETSGLNLGKLAGMLRAALAGRSVAPSVFDMMVALGPDEALGRIGDAAQGGPRE